MYAKNVQSYVDGPFKNSKGLGAAKHRYESWAKPFAMVVMTLPALIRTAEEISLVRAGKPEGKDADRFLKFLNAERVLQLGMLADGADEAYLLIRIFDDEETDPARQSDELWMFRRRVALLFGHQTARWLNSCRLHQDCMRFFGDANTCCETAWESAQHLRRSWQR